ncbi:hypothetical protein G7Y89_g525 [Cudoniella acicularis]|uniref:Heterokaryon incompatibility domain-containing protein n=1 Tax=Cudoniella acicularis TaxID=354080 RepID=A0A8H4W8S9_9HELO|nr:hypothetical protein G7Y89_g525 [Cudoniella acicularis]
MRLLHTTSLQLEEFFDQIPEYVILSHRWEEEEVIFKDMDDGGFKHRKGYGKLQGTCAQAARDGYDWVWIDTCCIDKSSSSELSEAINSMYSWYRNASICYAYLADVPSKRFRFHISPRFRSTDPYSAWFSRGWTLQELVAPLVVEFYAADWSKIGTKLDLKDEISSITGIATNILEGDDPFECNIAQRMSWASQRITSREEDIVYCLLGLFEVNMPLIYGEGESKAFARLQKEIMKISEDHTIFLWSPCCFPDHGRNDSGGLLAISPTGFCRKVSCRHHSGFQYSELKVLEPEDYSMLGASSVDATAVGETPSLRSRGVQLPLWLVELNYNPLSQATASHVGIINVLCRGQAVGMHLSRLGNGMSNMFKNARKFVLIDSTACNRGTFKLIFVHQPSLRVAQTRPETHVLRSRLPRNLNPTEALIEGHNDDLKSSQDSTKGGGGRRTSIEVAPILASTQGGKSGTKTILATSIAAPIGSTIAPQLTKLLPLPQPTTTMPHDSNVAPINVDLQKKLEEAYAGFDKMRIEYRELKAEKIHTEEVLSQRVTTLEQHEEELERLHAGLSSELDRAKLEIAERDKARIEQAKQHQEELKQLHTELSSKLERTQLEIAERDDARTDLAKRLAYTEQMLQERLKVHGQQQQKYQDQDQILQQLPLLREENKVLADNNVELRAESEHFQFKYSEVAKENVALLSHLDEAVARLASQAPNPDPYIFDDRYFSNQFSALKYDIKDWASRGFSSSSNVKRVSTTTAEAFEYISVNWEIYGESNEHRPAFVQAFVWNHLLLKVFGAKLWGTYTSVLEDYRNTRGREPQHQKLYHEWRAAGARLAAPVGSAAQDIDALALQHIPRVVQALHERLGIWCTMGKTQSSDILQKIVMHAVMLDLQMQQQKAYFTFLNTKELDKETEYNPDIMEVRFGTVRSSRKHSVVLIYTPALLKNGNSDGQNYDTTVVVEKALVDIEVPRRRKGIFGIA